MMSDDLEPGPDPRKVRNPLSRRPAEPPRVDQVLRSLTEDRAFSIRRSSAAEALAIKAEISTAVHYLNKWHGYDVRVRPYVTEHYNIRNKEWTYNKGTKKLAEGWYHGDEYRSPADFAKILSSQVGTHYYKTNFWVHEPLPRGFRTMDEATISAAHKASAATRGVNLRNKATSVQGA